MAGKLQPHGAEPDHAGTADLIWLIHDLTPACLIRHHPRKRMVQ
jgi:hypothetical protein